MLLILRAKFIGSEAHQPWDKVPCMPKVHFQQHWILIYIVLLRERKKKVYFILSCPKNDINHQVGFCTRMHALETVDLQFKRKCISEPLKTLSTSIESSTWKRVLILVNSSSTPWWLKNHPLFCNGYTMPYSSQFSMLKLSFKCVCKYTCLLIDWYWLIKLFSVAYKLIE